MPDYDPRLVALYDEDNPDGPDHDHVRARADRLGARRILDLGCGTGILTVTLTGPGRTVVGVDPSATMLAYAAGREGGDRVQWVLGDSREIQGTFDYAVMTGNVAQHIPDGDWERTLEDLGRAVRSGTLTFESRNPRARAWDSWAGPPSVRTTDQGTLHEWYEVQEVAPGQVVLTAVNVFEDSGDRVVEQQRLVFREREVLEAQLDAAGFVVEHMWGDWLGRPFTDDSPLVVIEARRR